MKFKMFQFTSMVLCVIITAIASFSNVFEPVNLLLIQPQNIITQSESGSTVEENEFDGSKVLEARFLNMLNHSFVYDTDFEDVESIVNQSIIALLNMRDINDDSYIAQNIVSDYVYSMYGISDIDFSSINTMFPQKQGFVYIIPRGFWIYDHEMISATQNEDGSFTVKTNISVLGHDDSDFVGICETLFVKNEASRFGYNIIYSNISEDFSFAI